MHYATKRSGFQSTAKTTCVGKIGLRLLAHLLLALAGAFAAAFFGADLSAALAALKPAPSATVGGVTFSSAAGASPASALLAPVGAAPFFAGPGAALLAVGCAFGSPAPLAPLAPLERAGDDDAFAAAEAAEGAALVADFALLEPAAAGAGVGAADGFAAVVAAVVGLTDAAAGAGAER